MLAESRRREPALVQVALHVAVGVDAGGLRKHVLADDGLVRRHAAAREHLDEPADFRKRALVDRGLDAGVVSQRHDHFVERHVAGALAHAVHGDVHAVRPGDGRLERVGSPETVVVVAVEVEMAARKLFDDASDELAHLQRRQQSQRIGQHDALDGHLAERFDVLVDVVRRSRSSRRTSLRDTR